MTKRIIVNADDYGLTNQVTLGIIKAHQEGVVSSTTMMMNMPDVEQGVRLAKENPKLGIGVHMVLSIGRPLLADVPSLTDENGNFCRVNQEVAAKIKPEELKREWKAQIEKYIELFGHKPTHLDSHHHTHLFNDMTKAIALELGAEYGVPVRSLTTKGGYSDEVILVNNFYHTPELGNNISEELFVRAVDQRLDNGAQIVEVMCHPSLALGELDGKSAYNEARSIELEVLSSDNVKQYIKDKGLELVTFNAVK